MKTIKSFPFEKARRITASETASARKAIAKKTGQVRKSRGRPPVEESDKYVPTSIRLHPKVLSWAKKEAKRKGIGYQTVINQSLIRRISNRSKSVAK